MTTNKWIRAKFAKRKLPLYGTMLVFGLIVVMACVINAIRSSGISKDILIGSSIGAFITALSFIGRCFNRKAFLIIKGSHVSAKYNWFGRLDCDASEIKFAISNGKKLTILLKNDKRHTITEIANIDDIGNALHRIVGFNTERSPQELEMESFLLKDERSKHIICTAIGSAFTFVAILISLIVNGVRFSAYSTNNRIVFMTTVALCIYPTIAAIRAAIIAHRMKLDVKCSEYVLRRRTIETASLPPYKSRRVFTDRNFMGRIIFFEDDDNTINTTIEVMIENSVLFKLMDSRLVPQEVISHALSGRSHILIDITDIYD